MRTIYLEVFSTRAAAANRILHMVSRAAWLGGCWWQLPGPRSHTVHLCRPKQFLAAVPAVKGTPWRGGGRLRWRAKSSAGVPMHAIALGEGKARSRQPAKAAPRQSGVCRSVLSMSPHSQRYCSRAGRPTTTGERSTSAAQKRPQLHAASHQMQSIKNSGAGLGRAMSQRRPSQRNESRNKIVCAGACLCGPGPCCAFRKEAAERRPKEVRTHDLLMTAPTEGLHGAHASRQMHASNPMPVMVKGRLNSESPLNTHMFAGPL